MWKSIEYNQFQVQYKGQLAPSFNIAPYAEAFKRGVLPVEHRDIAVDLAEIFRGCTKRMAVGGYVAFRIPVTDILGNTDQNGHFSDGWNHIIDVHINPGALAGSRWVYPLPDGNYVAFTLKDKPDARYRRDGSDVVVMHRLSLRDALLGATVRIVLFTGETVELQFEQPVFPGFVKRIEGFGFPLPTKPWKRADLLVEFDVVFPDAVDKKYHETIQKLL